MLSNKLSKCLKLNQNSKTVQSNLKSTNVQIVTLVHQNIQGVLGKDLELELFMNCNGIDILCITEHWLRPYQFMFNFDNHVIGSSFSRKLAIHGGSLILINKKLKYKERLDIVSLSVERTIEMACVELEQCIVVSVYKPPSADYVCFENKMEEALLKISNKNKKIFICGDFNIDLLLKNYLLSTKLLSLFQSYNCKNIFLEPTRITAHSATCIDNIFTDCPVTSISNKCIINKLTSDHCGQMIKIKMFCKNKSRKKITIRPKSTGRLERFKNNLLLKLSSLGECVDPNDQYESFFKIFSEEHDSIFTSKDVFVNNSTCFSEWATVGIHKSRNRLYELYSERTLNRSEEFKDYVRKYSKLFKTVCKIAKSRYLSKKIKNSDDKIKMTWNIINAETGRSKCGKTDYCLSVDGGTVNSEFDIASVFDKFFVDIPISTTKSLNSCSSTAETLLKENVEECSKNFVFGCVNYVDVIKVYNSLKLKNTVDLFGHSVSLIKTLITVIAPQLALIFNKCITCGIFPDLMKYSKITPIFKSGSTSDPSNFRPVSVLPIFSKIFEKLILNQLNHHFRTLMNCKQFGFTRGRSTTDAGVELIQHIYDAWEDSMDALGIFCDLSKAFDCVQHETLIRKLRHYGIRNTALDLIISYLYNRIQTVDINGKRTPGSVIKMGVPQGSILGPFLFLIYINDLPYLTKDNHQIVLFADDTSLIFKIKRRETALNDVNEALSKVVHWFHANNLLLNCNKTRCIKFMPPNASQVETRVLINGELLDVVDTTEFLGVTLDKKLQWGPHIVRLSKRLSSAAFAIKKIRQLIGEDTARLVYFSCFHSRMSYGILLWGHAADVQTVFVLQKRAVRAIYGLSNRHSLREKFKEINILTLPSQYILDNLIFVHKNIEHFKKNSDYHNANTRNRHKLALVHTRLSKIGKSFKGQCVRFYNGIPLDIQKLSVKKFKILVKQKLIKKAYYTIKEYVDDKNAWN